MGSFKQWKEISENRYFFKIGIFLKWTRSALNVISSFVYNRHTKYCIQEIFIGAPGGSGGRGEIMATLPTGYMHNITRHDVFLSSLWELAIF